MLIVRYDLSSALAWSLEYDRASSTDTVYDIAVGPDGVYACGASGDEVGFPSAVIIKRTFNGTFQWAQTHAAASSTNNQSFSLAVNPVGDAFATGNTVVGGATDMVSWKVSSAGAFQWARIEHVDGKSTFGEDIAVDAYGNSYACGRKHGPGDSPAAFVTRYNPNGTTNWSDLRNEGSNDTSLVITIDSKGDVITGSLTDGLTNDLMMIQKFIQLPVANPDTYAAVEGNTRTVAAPGIRLNDVFIDSAVAEGVTSPTKGVLTLNPNGSFTYRPNVGQSGVDSFTYRLQKNVMESNVAAVSFTITPLSPASLSFSPNVIYSGQSTTGTVTLNGTAFAGGVFVGITRNSLSLLGADSVAVPAGATSATFPITAGTVSAMVVRTVTVTRSAISRTASITIHPSPALVSLVISPNVVTGGMSTTGRVTLASASPPGGLPVALHSASGAITVPSSVTVPAGATFANFPITTSAVGSTFVRTVTATLNGVTRSANLTLNPP